VFDEGLFPALLYFLNYNNRYIQMLFTSTQFRTLFVELSFAAQKPLNTQEFILAAAERNIFVSFITASFIANDLEAINEVQASVEEKELVTA
jgi:hypothetical protein